MAALVLGLAGAAIGGSTAVTGVLGISATMGASIGWSIGSMLGGMLGPKTKIEGPRLQDGKVQASTHGQAIPIIYGSFRTAGNIIDFSGMREHAKTERSKKAKSQVTTYSYECDVAVGICAGVVGGVRRIWANNELIYSVAEDADLATIQASNAAAGDIRFYKGDEDQLPDPTLEALHGAGNVPAYRGLAYIVISRIWVEKYGNRLPNFEFEVVGRGSKALTFKKIDTTAAEMSGTPSSVRAFNRYFLTNGWRYTNQVAFDNHYIAWRTELQQPYRAALGRTSGFYDDGHDAGGYEPAYQELSRREYADQWGLRHIETTYRTFDTRSSPDYYIFTGNDGYSAVLSTYAGHGALLDQEVGGGQAYPQPMPHLDLYRQALIVISDEGDFVRVPVLPAWREASPIGTDHAVCNMAILHIDAKSVLIGYSYNQYAYTSAYQLVKASIRRNIMTGALEVYDMHSAGQLVTTVISLPSIWPIYRQGTALIGDFVFFPQGMASKSLTRIHIPTGAKSVINFPSVDGYGIAAIGSLDDELVLFFRKQVFVGSQPYYTYKRVKSDSDGNIIAQSDWSQAFIYPQVSSDLVHYVSSGNLFISIYARGSSSQLTPDGQQASATYILADSMTREGVPLITILSDVCGMVGVSPDLAAMAADITVGGYAVGRQMPARGAIEPLQNAYFFDAVESDNGLKFVMRGGDSVATIVDEDMLAGIDQPASGDPCAIVRGQEVELPQQVSVSYADWDSDYQTSAELVQRQATPSVNRVATELPIAMSATQAARIADVWMYQAWSERTQLTFKVGPKHMLLEPTDVVTVQTAGRSFKARITGKTDDRGVIDMAVVVDGGRYTSSATGSSNFGSQTQTAALSNTLLFLLDSPSITDAESDAGFYAAMLPEAILGGTVRWPGSTLLAAEGANAAKITLGSVSSPPACVGVVLHTVAAGRQGRVDQSQAILVRTNQTEMHSITRQQLLNGGNLFAVVSGRTGVVRELLQFQFAEEVGDFNYRLTGLLRGRFGTDASMLAIEEGFYLVQLNPRNGVLRVPAQPAQIGMAAQYRAVTNGGPIEDAVAYSYAPTGRALRPYAPVRVHAWRVGYDWHIRWVRRSRVDGGWRESVDVPLGEAQELYSVRIEPHGQEFTTGTPSFIYTEAMQLAGGGRVADFWFSVAQVSAAVGRGDAAFWKNY